MRLVRYVWWLPLLFALGGFVLASTASICVSPGTWIGPQPISCTVEVFGLLLTQQAAGWLFAGIGVVLGTASALILSGETARWTWPSVRHWIARGGLIIVVGGLVVVAGAVVLSRVDFSPTPSSVEARDPKLWIVQPGETLRVPADETQPGDSWECPVHGGVAGTPQPGQRAGIPGVFSMEVDAEGNVTAHCHLEPPLND